MGELLTAFGNAFAASAPPRRSRPRSSWGVLSVALSPCHLSSVPLVVAYMSGGAELPTGRRALAISSAFAVGILASIAVIGAVTAAAGRMLGDVGRAGTWTLAAVFFAFGLNLLGVLPLPSFGAKPTASAPPRSARGTPARARVRRRARPVHLRLHGAAARARPPRRRGRRRRTASSSWRSSGSATRAAIAFAGASFQSVQRWLGWKAGARAVELLRAGAGVAVLGGGAYFVWTAL